MKRTLALIEMGTIFAKKDQYFTGVVDLALQITHKSVFEVGKQPARRKGQVSGKAGIPCYLHQRVLLPQIPEPTVAFFLCQMLLYIFIRGFTWSNFRKERWTDSQSLKPQRLVQRVALLAATVKRLS